MSTQPPVVAPPPAPPAPVHPPIPLGLGSYVGMSGISGTVAVFLIAWGENHWHMTSPIAALGVAAVGGIIGFVGSRSHQAAALIAAVKKDLGEVGIEVSPPAPK